MWFQPLQSWIHWKSAEQTWTPKLLSHRRWLWSKSWKTEETPVVGRRANAEVREKIILPPGLNPERATMPTTCCYSIFGFYLLVLRFSPAPTSDVLKTLFFFECGIVSSNKSVSICLFVLYYFPSWVSRRSREFVVVAVKEKRGLLVPSFNSGFECPLEKNIGTYVPSHITQMR